MGARPQGGCEIYNAADDEIWIPAHTLSDTRPPRPLISFASATRAGLHPSHSLALRRMCSAGRDPSLGLLRGSRMPADWPATLKSCW
jgi:hypothetical protein